MSYLKDKDKRICRHTWGVLIGCYPCGVVVLFDEIFGSGKPIFKYLSLLYAESVSQVYALVCEWLSELKEEERRKLT